MKILRLFLTVTLTTLFWQGYSATKTAAVSGRWEVGSTWFGGVVPVCGDSIIIGAGKVVEISSILDFSLCAQSMIVTVSGTLTFQTGKKLKLPCNSQITLSSTGAITGGGGGGSSNLIDICSSTVWTVSMGNLSGPLVLQLNPLPVELAHFSARTEGESIVLNWVTFSELNNDYYVVEKSKNGVEYKELGIIDGAGTSSNINGYKMIDIIPYHGIQYYRLKQVDFDGKSVTSELIAVKWQKGTECSIYPNPGKGELFANIDPSYDKQRGKLIINNIDGKLVLSKDIQVNGSFHGIKLLQNQEWLKPGSYLVTLTFRDKSFSQYIVSK